MIDSEEDVELPASESVTDTSAPRIDDHFLKREIKRRDWPKVRDSWVGFIPSRDYLLSKPDPGLEKLETLLEVELGKDPLLIPDVVGLRGNALAEAVYLYRKATNILFSVESMSDAGYQSWMMFNAYHGAYLSTKAILTLFGVPLAYLNRQVVIDLFPEPEVRASKAKPVGKSEGRNFKLLPISNLDQQGVWKILQRIINTSRADCLSKDLVRQIKRLDCRRVTPPRNHFLYKAIYWPLEDIDTHVTFVDARFLRTELDEKDDGFLLCLFFCMYRLLEELLGDLSKVAGSELSEALNAIREWEDSATTPLRYRSFCELLEP